MQATYSLCNDLWLPSSGVTVDGESMMQDTYRHSSGVADGSDTMVQDMCR